MSALLIVLAIIFRNEIFTLMVAIYLAAKFVMWLFKKISEEGNY